MLNCNPHSYFLIVQIPRHLLVPIQHQDGSEDLQGLGQHVNLGPSYKPTAGAAWSAYWLSLTSSPVALPTRKYTPSLFLQSVLLDVSVPLSPRQLSTHPTFTCSQAPKLLWHPCSLTFLLLLLMSLREPRACFICPWRDRVGSLGL